MHFKCSCTVSSQNISSCFTHYFEAKVGRGCLLEYSISLVLAPHPTRFLTMLHTRSTITVTAVAFTEHVLWEIRAVLVLTKLRGIEATCTACVNTKLIGIEVVVSFPGLKGGLGTRLHQW